MNTLTHNNSSFKDLAYQLYKHMSDKYAVLKNEKPQFIINNKQQSNHILGPTANYNPQNKTITVYSFERHPKDMLRSFAHEVIHHVQNCEGRLTGGTTYEGYALDDPMMLDIEREAYEQGNMCFREFEDLYKRQNPINEADDDMYSKQMSKSPTSISKISKKIDKPGEFKNAFSTWFQSLGYDSTKISLNRIRTDISDVLSNMGYK